MIAAPRPITATRDIADRPFDSPRYAAGHLGYSGALGGSRSAVTPAQIDTAMRGLAARCLTLRADAVADAMSRAVVERQQPDGSWQPVEAEHPMQMLLRAPSRARSAFVFWHYLSLAWDTLGEVPHLIDRDARGVPVEMLPVYREFGEVRPVPDGYGGASSYVFHPEGGGPVPLEAEDVVMVRDYDIARPYESRSLLRAMGYDVDIALFMKQYRRAQLAEGGLPDRYYATDQDLTKAQKERIAEGLRDYTGVEGAGRHLILSNGAKIASASAAASELQFIEGSSVNRADLLDGLGVPEGLIMRDANRANADAAFKVFMQLTIRPRVGTLCSTLTLELRRAFEANFGLRVAPPDVVPMDREQQARVDQVRIQTGTPINRILAERGEEPVEGGDVPRASAIITPLTMPAAATPPAEGDAGSAERAAPRTHRRISPAGRITGVSRALFTVAGQLRASGSEMTEATLEAEWRSVDETRTSYALPAAADMTQLFEEQGERAEAAILAAGEERGMQMRRGDDTAAAVAVSTAFDLVTAAAETSERLLPHILAALQGGVEAGALRASVTLVSAFDPESERMRSVTQRILAQSETISQTTASRIEEAIRTGVREGDTYADLAGRVRALFSDMAPHRADAIARTTATAAFEAGQVEAFEEGGVDAVRWLSERDGNAREEHDEADGQEVDAGLPFTVGGEELAHPGDPAGSPANIINCRCTTLPIVRAERSAPTTRRRVDADVKARYDGLTGGGMKSEAAVRQIAEEINRSVSTVERRLGWKK